MPSFDPSTVRKAVEEFTPRRPQNFQDLLPAKDVITELRQKRASYRSIAHLVTQHCLPISKSAIRTNLRRSHEGAETFSARLGNLRQDIVARQDASCRFGKRA